MQSYPSLPLELAETVLVAAIRSIRYIRRSDSAKQAPFLNIALRSLIPEVTKAAIARQVWVDMDHASACGDVNLLNLMVRMSQLPEYANSLSLHYTAKAMDSASERGDLDVLKWWVAHHDLLPLKYSSAAIDRASECGRVDVLEWWASESGLPLRYSIVSIQSAAREGHLQVLDWWLRQTSFRPEGYSSLAACLDYVGVTGHFEVIEWWIANRDAVASRWTEEPFTSMLVWTAFDSGNVRILDWANGYFGKEFVDVIMADSIDVAVENGRRSSLEWLVQHKLHISNDNIGIELAVFRNKDKDLGKWLLDIGISQVSLGVFLQAFECADVDYVDWCFEQLDPDALNQMAEEELFTMFLTACSVGSVDLLDWIVLQLEWEPAHLKGHSFPPIEIEGREFDRIEECFVVASHIGNVDVLDWLVGHGFACLDPVLAMTCVSTASYAGKPQVVAWLSQDPMRSSMRHWKHDCDFDGLAEMLHLTLQSSFADGEQALQKIGVLRWYWNLDRQLFQAVGRNRKAFAQSRQVLEWWADVVEPLFPSPLMVSLDLLTNPDVLEWWLTSGRLDYTYTSAAMDQASAAGNIALLECWKRFALAHPIPHGSPDGYSVLKYTEAALNEASRCGKLETLQWWATSGISPLKFSEHVAFDFTHAVSSQKRAEIVRWWLSPSLTLD